MKVFKKAIEEYTENAEAYYGMVISSLLLGDNKTVTIPQLVQAAIYSFKKALNFGATYPAIYYLLSWAMLSCT